MKKLSSFKKWLIKLIIKNLDTNQDGIIEINIKYDTIENKVNITHK